MQLEKTKGGPLKGGHWKKKRIKRIACGGGRVRAGGKGGNGGKREEVTL